MAEERKLNVALIFGGRSNEHEISLKSAFNIANFINKSKYNIYYIKITKDGIFYLLNNDPNEIFKNNFLNEATLSLSKNEIILFEVNSVKKIKIDVYFPILHGKNGEDGTIQGIFELSKSKYVGSKMIGSAICMDKAIFKDIIANENINQAKFMVLRNEQINSNKVNYESIEKQIGYPCFVKPANSGSSIGIYKCKNKDELILGIKEASKHDKKIVIEESIENAIEIECSVIGNDRPIISNVLGQITPANEFYDYDSKYNSSSKITIPANLKKETIDTIKKYAKIAYKKCECKGLSRIDFLISNDIVYLNEINTLPGFTDISMFPMLFNYENIDTTTLIDKLIEYALEEN